jgi:hypothetical protein
VKQAEVTSRQGAYFGESNARFGRTIEERCAVLERENARLAQLNGLDAIKWDTRRDLRISLSLAGGTAHRW